MLDTKQLISKMFMWLAIGLLITFGVGIYVQNNEALLVKIFSGGLYAIIAIVTCVLAIVFQLIIKKLKSSTALILYLIYTALEGVTFSAVFAIYNLQSILLVFGIAAILFLVFGYIGYKTELDLSKLTVFLLIGLIGIILATLINLFLGSEMLDLGITIISVIVFTIYIAYDIQLVKRKLYSVQDENSLAILGALWLHIDIVAIIWDLLRLFGKEE